MLQIHSWKDYLETIIFLLVLYYLVVFAVFYRDTIRLLTQGKFFKTDKPGNQDVEDEKNNRGAID
jgi:hypothetical protein